MAETLTIRTASSTEVVKIAVPGPQGPKGDKGDPGDVAGLPLSTQGDLLYRGASENQRLPIGTTGQVLKVAGGIPSWANESGAVTSVNGQTGAVTVAVPSASSTTPAALGTAAVGSASTFARADHVHAMPTANDLGLGSDDTVTFGGVVIVDSEDGLSLTQGSIQHSSGFVIDAEASVQSATTFSGPIDFGGADPSVTKTTVRSNLGLGSAATANLNAISDSDLRIVGSTDATKKVAIEVDTNVPANTTVTLTAPSASGTLALAGAAPAAHKASHATGGTDALTPSDIGAQSIFTSEQLTLTTTAQVTLSAARAKVLTIVQYAGGNVDVIMPQSGYIDGDVFVFKWGTGSDSVVIREVAAGSPITTIAAGQQKRVQRVTPGGWVEVPVDTHTHTPSEVGLGNVSNTAQVTSVTGTAPIVSSGGTTPTISVTTGTTAGTVAAGDDSRITGAAQKSANLSDLSSASTARTNLGVAIGTDVAAASHTHTASAISDSTTAGRALLTAADAAAQRTSLGLAAIATSGSASDLGSGTVPIARIPTGSTSTTVALGNHSHELTALAATGATNGHVLTANGSNGVTFAALPASGVTGAASSASDVLGVSGANITGVDAGSADRLVFWDDSASKLTYLEAGSGLSISGTTLTATASGGSKTYAVFTAEHNQPPSTAFATLDTRNSIAVLDFDAATDENAVFVGIMPEAASLGSGLIVRLHWMATSATSGNVRWGVQFERSNTDLDADSFDTAVEATAATNGTSGIITTTAITITTIDGITAGDVFRLKVFRNADDATNDTMTGDAELVAVEVRSAA